MTPDHRKRALAGVTAAALASALAGCSSSASSGSSSDAGASEPDSAVVVPSDAGGMDSTAADAGSSPDDAGSPSDTGASPDATSGDASTPGVAGVIETLSVDMEGGVVSGSNPHLSADGRYVAFFEPIGDTILAIRDTCIGAIASSGCTPSTSFASVGSSGALANDGIENYSGWLSGDGRFATILSVSTNLLAAPPPTTSLDTFVRDTCQGADSGCSATTFLASVSTGGVEANELNDMAAISSNGRMIAFRSDATNLSTLVGHSIYAHDTCFGAAAGCTPSTTLVSTAVATNHPNNAQGAASDPTLSDDGRYVAYTSNALETTPDTNNSMDQVYLTDLCTGVAAGCSPSTVLVSAAQGGSQGNAASEVSSVGADGRFVLFDSIATNLVSNTVSGDYFQVYLRDTCLGPTAAPTCAPTTTLVSLASDGNSEGNSDSYVPYATAISSNGRLLEFGSGATNLLAGSNAKGKFVRDTCFGAPAGCAPSLVLVSVDGAGTPLDIGAPSSISSGIVDSAMSSDGHYVAFVYNQQLELAATGF